MNQHLQNPKHTYPPPSLACCSRFTHEPSTSMEPHPCLTHTHAPPTHTHAPPLPSLPSPSPAPRRQQRGSCRRPASSWPHWSSRPRTVRPVLRLRCAGGRRSRLRCMGRARSCGPCMTSTRGWSRSTGCVEGRGGWAGLAHTHTHAHTRTHKTRTHTQALGSCRWRTATATCS